MRPWQGTYHPTNSVRLLGTESAQFHDTKLRNVFPISGYAESATYAVDFAMPLPRSGSAMGQLSGQRKNSAVDHRLAQAGCSPLGSDRCGVALRGTGRGCAGRQNFRFSEFQNFETLTFFPDSSRATGGVSGPGATKSRNPEILKSRNSEILKFWEPAHATATAQSSRN
jgi:hypothetical protein